MSKPNEQCVLVQFTGLDGRPVWINENRLDAISRDVQTQNDEPVWHTAIYVGGCAIPQRVRESVEEVVEALLSVRI